MDWQKSHSVRGSDNSIDLEGEGTREWCLHPYNIRVPKIESSRAEKALVIPLSLVGLQALLSGVSTGPACCVYYNSPCGTSSGGQVSASTKCSPMVPGCSSPESKRQRQYLAWLETWRRVDRIHVAQAISSLG